MYYTRIGQRGFGRVASPSNVVWGGWWELVDRRNFFGVLAATYPLFSGRTLGHWGCLLCQTLLMIMHSLKGVTYLKVVNLFSRPQRISGAMREDGSIEVLALGLG